MINFEKQAEKVLPCTRGNSCTSGMDFPCNACRYRPRIVALLKAADAQARRETWGKAARKVCLGCYDELAIEWMDKLRCHRDKQGNLKACEAASICAEAEKEKD